MLISTRNNLCKYLLVCLLVVLCGCRQKPADYPSITPPITEFSVGDIAFRLGRSVQSGFIASAGRGENGFSHIGLIVECDSTLMVAHIEPDNTRPDECILCERIEDFFARDVAAAGCVKRLEGLDYVRGNAIVRHALRLKGSGVEFDHDYLLSDTTAMYCTEFVEYIFLLEGIELSQSRRRTLPLVKESVILPSDIAENEHLNDVWRFSYDLPAR